jgi:eukaryotic-like serine/threonine-protein kinase
MRNAVKRLLEFGPFRIDPEQRVLLRAGQTVPLSPKAFDLLLVLTQRSGQVVLKDDLMKLLWPDTFVEESNLGQHVFQLRKALGERPQDHTYITTVPGRGYRFAQTVETVADAPAHSEIQKEDKEEQIVVASHSLARVVIEKERKSDLRLWMAVGAIVVAILVAVGVYWRSQRRPKLAETDTIMLADFFNRTGDPVFDDTLREGLSAQLAQSPFLNLLSDSRTGQTLALMGRPKDAQLTPEVAREVCQRTASAAVLNGSIAQIGTHYLLTLEAIACSSGESLASTEAEASDKNHVLDALGKVASEIRSRLGESLASVQKYDAPPEDVTTPSLEALQSYGRGYQVMIRGDWPLGISLFQRATDLDPNFAMAYARLGTLLVDSGETVQGEENIRKAYGLRNHVSEWEKFYIATHYEDMVTGNLEAARKTYELWAQVYPRNRIPLGNLGIIYVYLGDFDKVLAVSREEMQLVHGGGMGYGNLTDAYLFQNLLEEAKATAQEAHAHHVDQPSTHLSLYQVAFLQHDEAGMEREAAELIDKPGWEDVILHSQSQTAAYSGRFGKARELTRRAVDSARGADKHQAAATYDGEAAVREALAGNVALAKRQAQAALALSDGRQVTALAALALALAGDSNNAKRLADILGKHYPEDTIVQSNSLPTIRAAVALQSLKPAEAIETLTAAAPHELGLTDLSVGFSLYPVYLRGQAYLAAKRGFAAATEFQKILDHPGVVQNEPIGALAHLGLGRAYVLTGNTSKARSAYQDFLVLWKDADPDIPILKQSKAECARLE